MGRSLTWTLVVPALAAAACNAVFGVDELRFDPGAEASGASDGSGAGGSGGSGGGSTTNSGPGGAGGCDPALCPGIDTACRSRACTDDVCGFVDAAEGTACSGGVCDGQGSCVACLTEDDCDAADLCVEGTCVPPHCSDGELSGDESDVDCGGSCLLCPAMSDCGGDDDCLGNICLFGNCHACGLIGNGELSGCQPDHYCVEGTCVVRKLDGDLCKDDDECLSDECASDDGTCCDASCEGTCEACLVAKTGVDNGTCALIAAGDDPDAECDDEGPTSCGAVGQGCSGTAARCVVYAEGTVCSDGPICQGGQEGSSAMCDGMGSCVIQNASSCHPYNCDDRQEFCATTCSGHNDCVSSHHCAPPACTPDKVLGDACGDDAECPGSDCVDGVCCDSNCGGVCRACNVQGSAGTCTDIPAGTDPDNECATTCNGNGSCT